MKKTKKQENIERMAYITTYILIFILYGTAMLLGLLVGKFLL